MILSDKEIKAYNQNPDAPLIEPFREDHLQSASYDVSLSGNIAVLKRIGKVINPADDQDLDDMYEKATIGAEGYLFSPGEYLLAELEEAIKIPENLIAHIRPRTRFTRTGILIADQHCNPTYEGKLYIGLRNAGPNAVLLWPGLRVAQFVFEELSSVPDRLYKDKQNAAFQREDSFRKARFGEAGLNDEEKRIYDKVLSSFEKGDK